MRPVSDILQPFKSMDSNRVSSLATETKPSSVVFVWSKVRWRSCFKFFAISITPREKTKQKFKLPLHTLHFFVTLVKPRKVHQRILMQTILCQGKMNDIKLINKFSHLYCLSYDKMRGSVAEGSPSSLQWARPQHWLHYHNALQPGWLKIFHSQPDTAHQYLWHVGEMKGLMSLDLWDIGAISSRPLFVTAQLHNSNERSFFKFWAMVVIPLSWTDRLRKDSKRKFGKNFATTLAVMFVRLSAEPISKLVRFGNRFNSFLIQTSQTPSTWNCNTCSWTMSAIFRNNFNFFMIARELQVTIVGSSKGQMNEILIIHFWTNEDQLQANVCKCIALRSCINSLCDLNIYKGR